ncbi:hypothetical protein SNOG_06230 [Parastagonospora nodorum SN15]|uniref:Uncharacterized protein n=1 Tax=Phaeosphaeria nodorum (strain SN15 / ATCC MYA-4574 / FGSC 10173) TaxID=321614 RepID=Q0UPT4_PHANO|nr:hypothetical protein SNOG_06230 [Parastagonospora nodorum SN15]EAT86061.1 hypothetical protein SNOG_06230 [Parastagonospora nodorum SN15]
MSPALIGILSVELYFEESVAGRQTWARSTTMTGKY